LKTGFYEYSLIATSTGGSTEAPGGSFEPPPGVLDPPGPGASPLSGGVGQPPASGSGVQSDGSAGHPSSSTPGAQSPGPQAPTTKLKSLTNAQKLANALKACKRKPKRQRADCAKQARKQYGKATSKAKKS
jgi:hypothetical protein